MAPIVKWLCHNCKSGQYCPTIVEHWSARLGKLIEDNGCKDEDVIVLFQEDCLTCRSSRDDGPVPWETTEKWLEILSREAIEFKPCTIYVVMSEHSNKGDSDRAEKLWLVPMYRSDVEAKVGAVGNRVDVPFDKKKVYELRHRVSSLADLFDVQEMVGDVVYRGLL